MIKKVKVNLHFPDQYHEVGHLIKEDKRIFFKYSSEFIESGLEISPFKMPLSEKIYNFDDDFLDGLPGVFYDSLPDGWGRLILDRYLTSIGKHIDDLDSMDRLSYVGNNAWGALEYHPNFEVKHNNFSNFDLHQLYKEAINVYNSETQSNEILYNLSSSFGGARPKILVYITNENQLDFKASENSEAWIIKFSSSVDINDSAKVEYAYAQLANTAGIKMMETKLFYDQKNIPHFGIRRFDRSSSGKIHCASVAGLLHDNFRLPALDYGHLMQAAFFLEKDYIAYEKIFRQMLFNIFMCNRDDHPKNFAFCMDSKGQWMYAPAYDLTYSIPAHGHHSITIQGESFKPKISHIISLAKIFKIRDFEKILEEVETACANFSRFAKELDINKKTIKTIEKKTSDIRKEFYN